MNLSAIALFDNTFKQLGMSSRIEVAKFEPGPIFENTINENKDNRMKITASATMNISDITLSDNNFKQISMNSRIDVAKSEPETIFENTIIDIKANHLKWIAPTEMNISAITSNKSSLSSEHLKSDLMPCIILLSPEKSPQFTNHLYSMHPKGNT